MNKCRHTQYVYNASAYGFAAELERPAKHSIPTQAAAVLAASGGRGNARISNFKFDGIISVADAYTEVGGSYDEAHDLHTTYAYSVLQGVNIADILTADRVVARLTIYATEDPTVEPRFDITGSHFENLKIAGHEVAVKLATDEFHKLQTYSDIDAESAKEWQSGSKLGGLTADELEELKDDYHGLAEMAALVNPSNADGGAQQAKNGASQRPKNGTPKKANGGPQNRVYLLSPANLLELGNDEKPILGYGNIIFIPKFGLIRLAEMVVHKYSRVLTMFHIQMCSGTDGGASGGGAGGGGGMGAP